LITSSIVGIFNKAGKKKKSLLAFNGNKKIHIWIERISSRLKASNLCNPTDNELIFCTLL